jgi:hypothetical protein
MTMVLVEVLTVAAVLIGLKLFLRPKTADHARAAREGLAPPAVVVSTSTFSACIYAQVPFPGSGSTATSSET